MILQAVIAAVRQVSHEEIMPRYLKVARQHKSDGSLYTEADVAAQQALGRMLGKIRNAPILGEEMSVDEQRKAWEAGKDGLWCIDPIDGTTNFANGIPFFAVSVALMIDGKSVLGAIYNPATDEMFSARAGGGAWLGNERLPLRQGTSRLKSAVASVDFKRIPKPLAQKLAQTPPYSSERNFGACTLEWCYTAAGRFDAYLHGGQKLWDYAAGALILREAGGQLCCLGDSDFDQGDLWQRSAVAALDPTLFVAWKNWIADACRETCD